MAWKLKEYLNKFMFLKAYCDQNIFIISVPESPPTRVSCSPLSSSSMKVSWNPPPIGQHGGLIQGYKVIYSPLTTDHGRFIKILY